MSIRLFKMGAVMKKKILMLVCMLMILSVPLTAFADMGPKPSVVIDFQGLEGERYYATLLSKEKSTGPFSTLEGNGGEYRRYQEGDAGYEIFEKFAQYKDTDGYYFLQYFQDCSEAQRFSWTYYPPQEFKVLLYFSDTDRFVVSGSSYARYAFDSYFTAEPQDGSLRVIPSYDYTAEAISLFVRVVLTIAVELGIALLFGFREKRVFRFIVIINAVTQLALNVILNVINYHMGMLGFLLFYVLLELVIVLVEAVLYAVCLKKRSEKKISAWKPWIYALAANTASFIVGLVLAFWIPDMF